MHSSLILAVWLMALGVAPVWSATNAPLWNQFRGPNGSGTTHPSQPPVHIAKDQAAWITPLPAGKSSPVWWKNRIFITGLENERLVTMALDRDTGKVLWKKFAPRVALANVHKAGSPAASTPCVDEAGLYVYFGSYGLLCYDHDGNEQWHKVIPPPKSMYGISTSPIRHKDLLILVLDDLANLPDSKLSRSKVIALNHATGELIWETPRPFNRDSWSSPMIWNHDHGTDLVVLGHGRVYGYNPATGQEKWYVNGFSRETISIPVAGNNQLYVSSSMQGGRGDAKLDTEPFWQAVLNFDQNGNKQIEQNEISHDFTIPFRPELPPSHPGFGVPLPDNPEKRKERQLRLFSWRDTNKDGIWTREEFVADMANDRTKPNLTAIRPGGQGDITDTHVSWNVRRGIPEIPSPLFHRNRLYLIRDGGILTCVNTETGDVIYKERTGAMGQYSSSPVVANDCIYIISSRGMVTVVKSGDQFEITHQEDLETPVFGTPAMDADSLYIRTEASLIAFR